MYMGVFHFFVFLYWHTPMQIADAADGITFRLKKLWGLEPG
jgi:hypothetical protein